MMKSSFELFCFMQVVVGVVYNSILDELFVATRGQGATLNGRPIKASQTEALGSALFATEIGVTRDEATVSAVFSRISNLCRQVRQDQKLSVCKLERRRGSTSSLSMHLLLLQTRSMRALGSCALDLCSVACGRLDFMYEIGFGGCWDCAAGALIVAEAGGVVLDPSGGPFNVMSRRVLAGNKHVAKEAACILAAAPLGPKEPPPLPL